MDVVTVSSDVEQAIASRPPPHELVVAAMAGDDGAFEDLVTARLPRTYRMALAIVGSEADARDAVQETWIAAWRQLRTLLDPARFDAWLDQILVNACRTTLRKRGRVREIALIEEIDVAAPHPGPDAVTERDALNRAFSRLSVEQRAILVMHHLEHRPLATIADALGIPIGTAKSRLFTARAALQSNLETER
jgi:RNA polymerase sigma-70 factor (ECF subfamily)